MPTTDSPNLKWLNRRLRDLLMHAPSAIGITIGPEHRWVYINNARARMAGRAHLNDFLGKTVRESYPELEGQPFFPALDQAYRTGIPFVGNELKGCFNRGPGGAPDTAYLNCVYQPIRNDDGEVEGLLIHTVEVTEQVLARREAELANEREKKQRSAAEFERNQLRELFKQAPVGIAILVGPEFIWSFANAAYCSIVGRSSEQLLNRPVRETLPELSERAFFDLFDQVYRTGVPYIGKEMKAVLDRGPAGAPEEAYFDFIYQPVRNVSGEIEGIMVLAVEVTDQLQARNELESRVRVRTGQLQQARESLSALSGRLMQAQDEEHRRVARELHDSAGQYLAALQMNLSSLERSVSSFSPEVRERLKDSVDLAERCTSEIRTISYLLHPPLLDEMGLASALSWYVDGFVKRSGVAVSVEVPPNLIRFPPELETAVFRIVQQSLGNIHRHSQSKVARIRLSESDGSLTVEVADEGLGLTADMLDRFNRSGQLPGVGISGMRERVLGMRGTFELSSDSSGTTITVRLPIPGLAQPACPEISQQISGSE
jgi:PAS domain S-box-containing protein